MTNRRTTTGLAISILILGSAATACKETNSGPATGASSTATARATTGNDKAETKTVPNFVGMGLQSAQDAAQTAGFYSLESHDSLGRARSQILDRDWKVCSQNVEAGASAAPDTELDFGAVKLEEDCPAKDRSEPTTAGGKIPDFAGESVKAARAALDSGTSLTVEDASGDDRLVLVESNWKVCTQTPGAGAELTGQPVKLTAVKFDENCS